MTVADESLNSVLAKHRSIIRKRLDDEDEDGEPTDPVLRDDGKTGIVDLMLSRTILPHGVEERQHLVVELKRPSRSINVDVVSQVQKYALAVARDERFHDTKTTWVFWAVSNEVSEDAKKLANQKDRPQGVVFFDDKCRSGSNHGVS